MKSSAQCIVSAEDYRVYWKGEPPAPEHKIAPSYDGLERRKNVHNRRWLNDAQGRRRFDRKS